MGTSNNMDDMPGMDHSMMRMDDNMDTMNNSIMDMSDDNMENMDHSMMDM